MTGNDYQNTDSDNPSNNDILGDKYESAVVQDCQRIRYSYILVETKC